MAAIAIEKERKSFFQSIREVFKNSTSLNNRLEQFGIQGFVASHAIKEKTISENKSPLQEVTSRFSDIASRSWNVSRMGMERWQDFLNKNFMDVVVRMSDNMKKSVYYVQDKISGSFIPASSINPKLEKGLRKGIGKEVNQKMKASQNQVTKHESNCSQLWKANVKNDIMKSYKSLEVLLEAVVGSQFSEFNKGRPLGFVVSGGKSYYGYTDIAKEKSHGLFCEERKENTREQLIDKAMNFSNGREKIANSLRNDFGFNVDKNTSPNTLSSLMKSVVNMKVPTSLDDIQKLPRGDHWKKVVENIDNPINRNNKLKQEFNNRIDRTLRTWFAFDDKMTPKTPIVVKDRNVLRLDKVNKILSAENLEERIGSSYTNFMQDLNSKNNDSYEDRNVVEVGFSNKQYENSIGLNAGRIVEDENAFGGIRFVKNETANGDNNKYIVTFEGDGYNNPIVRSWDGEQQNDMVNELKIKELPSGNYPVVLNSFEGPDDKIAQLEIRRNKEPVFNMDGEKLSLSRFTSVLEAQDTFNNSVNSIQEKMKENSYNKPSINEEFQNEILAEMKEIAQETEIAMKV